MDAELHVRRWTQAAELMFGYARERALGLGVVQLVPFLAPPSGELEGWCRRADGSVFRGLVGTLSSHDPRQATGDTDESEVLVVSDITSRYMREQAMLRVRELADAKLQAVLDGALDAILIVDALGHVESHNQRALGMFRASECGLVGVALESLLELDGAPLPSPGLQLPAIGRRCDGSTFSVECNVNEFGAGSSRASLLIARDVTQRRQLERQVVDVTEQLQRQIGQDLHDGLGQLLTGTAFLAQGLQNSLASEHQPQAQRIVELINQAIARVRSLAHGLSPIHVEARSLEAVLRHTVSEASDLLGVACELSLHDFIDTARPDVIAQLCLIAREAITNAVRHGRARRIVVRLARRDDQSSMSIEDDGVGIGELDEPIEGLGLRSMRYRAQTIGGRLDIVQTRGGTTVCCAWRDG